MSCLILVSVIQVINKRRAEKPEVRQASREAALREVTTLPLSHFRICGEANV